MMSHRMVVVIGLLALLAPPAWAGAPTDQLRRTVDDVLRILNDPALRSPARREARRTELRRVVEPRFDFAETGRRALGRFWKERTEAERRQFTDLFRDLLEQTYTSRIESYKGERVVFTGEAVDGDYAIVRTKIITAHDTQIPVDYRMLRRGDRWLVYDVVIEEVSLVDNYRSQFAEIIEASSYQTLVKRIKAKLREAHAEAG